ncbi:hypothetical protein BJV74DRAFT_989562, partial [Russula compacta]
MGSRCAAYEYSIIQDKYRIILLRIQALRFERRTFRLRLSNYRNELSKAWAAFKFPQVHQAPIPPTNTNCQPFILYYLFNDNRWPFSGIKYRKPCCTSQKGTTTSSGKRPDCPSRDNCIASKSCPARCFRFLSF